MRTSKATFSRSAVLLWTGDVTRGTGQIDASSGAFSAAATFPRLSGEPVRTTTPEELLAASHAVCFGIGLRSVLAQRGGTATRLGITATITAEKSGGRIQIIASQLEAIVEGLAGIEPAMLDEIAREAEEACTISALLRRSVPITVTVQSTETPGRIVNSEFRSV
jgi:lipoyl-dependent peroxiredoxin